MKTGCIYRIYNRIDGKSYIGAMRRGPTTRQLERERIRRHLSGRSRCRAIAEAVEEHGIDTFDWQIIEYAVEIDRLKQMETHYICAFNTLHPHGYNLMVGNTPCEETRSRMSQAQKGKKHHAYGKPLSPEHRRKLSEAQKGKILSMETRRKMSEGSRGKTASKETREKISRAKKGQVPWNKGKRRT